MFQGFDPPHQSDTRTIYIANRFPQHGHYVPQKFADNRIISSKVSYQFFIGKALDVLQLLFIMSNGACTLFKIKQALNFFEEKARLLPIFSPALIPLSPQLKYRTIKHAGQNF